MPWEERNGRRYYYRKVRRGDRVFSVYEGSGLAGHVASEVDAEARQKREAERLTTKAELARIDRVDALIDDAWRMVQVATCEALEGAGYHSHKREWRLKRDGKAE